MRQPRPRNASPDSRRLTWGRWLIALGLILAAAFAFLPSAGAHASLVTSDPPDNAVRDQPLENVTAWFDLPLDPAQSTLQVFDSSGREVDLGQGGVDPSDPTVRTMHVSLPSALPPGYYVARWFAVSNEGVHTGHVTQGQFRFRLTAPGVSQRRGWAIIGLALVSTLGSIEVALRRKGREVEQAGEQPEPSLPGGPE